MWMIYALFASIIWGLSYTLDEQVLKSRISPAFLLACQSWLGAVFFTVLAYFSQPKVSTTILAMDKMVLWELLAALCVANLGAFFIVISIQAKNASLAALVEQSYPLFTLLFSYLLFKQNHLNTATLIGGGLIILGITVINFSR